MTRRVKLIIESIDGFGHQFLPVKFVYGDSDLSVGEYFALQIRRKLDFFVSDVCANVDGRVEFKVRDYEQEFIRYISSGCAGIALIESFPIWQIGGYGSRNEFYINNNLLDEFSREGVSGSNFCRVVSDFGVDKCLK